MHPAHRIDLTKAIGWGSFPAIRLLAGFRGVNYSALPDFRDRRARRGRGGCEIEPRLARADRTPFINSVLQHAVVHPLVARRTWCIAK